MLIKCSNPMWQKAVEINTAYRDKYVICEKRIEPTGRCYRTVTATFKLEEAEAYIEEEDKDYLVILFNGAEVDDPDNYFYAIKFREGGKTYNVDLVVNKFKNFITKLQNWINKF